MDLVRRMGYDVVITDREDPVAKAREAFEILPHRKGVKAIITFDGAAEATDLRWVLYS